MHPEIIDHLLNLAIQIQQIASPTFHEGQRAEFIQKCFLAAGLTEVDRDVSGNVYARLRGQDNRQAVVISAHLDTVFPAGTDLACMRTPDKIFGPGIGDNSISLAALLGVTWALGGSFSNPGSRIILDGDLWLVANVGEEGLGDLNGMKAVVNRIGARAMAYLVLEGMAVGQIYHRGLGVKRYRIRVHTRGGHSWINYGRPSAIHELVDLAVKIKNLPIPSDPLTSMNIGIISGGTSVNTIAADASLELDLRSVSPCTLQELVAGVLTLVEEAERQSGEAVQVQADCIGDRPAGEIPADHPLVKLAAECNTRQGVDTKLNIGSTDANVPLSYGLPAICIGLTTGGGAHTMEEYIDIPPLSQGLEILVDLVRSIFQQGS